MSAVDIRMPREIDDYHEKVYMGLSYRQLLWGALAIAAAVGTTCFLYFVCYFTLDSSLVPGMLVSVPFWAIGWLRPMGMKIEDYARLYFDFAFGPTKYPYKTDLPKCETDENFPIRMNPMTKKERKNYAKALQKEQRREFKRQSERASGRL